jgi:Tfp pilus assembly protein PilF
MRDNTRGELIDLGTLRLQRAAQRLERQDHAGAMDDLRAALQHMRRAGADPLEVEHLAAIIAATECWAS